MVCIDAHLHVFAQRTLAFPRETNAILRPERAESAEKLLATLSKAGIEQAVLVQIGGTAYEQHAYLLDCLRRYPAHFQGIGLLPPKLTNPALQMDRLAQGGVIGFRLSDFAGATMADQPLVEHPLYPIWQHAAVRDYVLWLYPRAADVPLIPRFLQEFPTVRVVLNHLGVTPMPEKFTWDEQDRPRVETPMPPPIAAVLEQIARHQQVVVTLSGQYAFSRQRFPYRDLAEWHVTLYRHFGADRLMWASDFPWILETPGYGALVGVLHDLLPGISERERAAIMGGTAQRVLRFPPPPSAN